MGIPEYFKGKNILVTGATGLVGKALIEKLLRCCPELSKIYIVIRPKQGQEPQERWNSLTNVQLFDTLRAVDPNALSKIVVFAGESTDDEFGLSSKNQKVIEDNVNLIYHVAASISFVDDIVCAINQNVRSTYSLLELAKRAKNLQGFIHISTAYTNFNRDGLSEELIYRSTWDWKILMKLAEDPSTHSALKALQPKLMDGHLTTYTLTKSLSEDAVNDYSQYFPVAILRPALIFGTISDPIPGCLDVDNFLTLICKGARMGVIRIMLNDLTKGVEQISLDHMVKAMIIATWQLSKEYVKGQPPHVMCCRVDNSKKITWGKIEEIGFKLVADNPTSEMAWYPFTVHIKNRMIYNIMTWFFHVIPGYFMDLYLQHSGKSPKLLKVYRRYFELTDMMEREMNADLRWTRQNYERLATILEKKDIEDFQIDEAHVDIDQYLKDQMQFVMNKFWQEERLSLEKRHQLFNRLKMLHYTFCTGVCTSLSAGLLYCSSRYLSG